MNTSIPFGKLIQTLNPNRKNIEAKFFLNLKIDNPANNQRDTNPLIFRQPTGKIIKVPKRLFRHKAIIYSDQGHPISEVHETYLKDLIYLII